MVSKLPPSAIEVFYRMELGSISQQQFQAEILGIEGFSRQDDSFSWCIRSTSNLPEDQYLCCRKTRVCCGAKDVQPTDDIALEGDELTTIEEEDLASLDPPRPEVCAYEYHVVYSASYGVPVLYFNAYRSDGQLLSLNDIWKNVPQCYQDRLKQEKWTFITQQEHPLLGRPFFQVHPCHTSNLMKQVPEKPRNYVVSWLSMVGPVVGIDIPMSYSEIG